MFGAESKDALPSPRSERFSVVYCSVKCLLFYILHLHPVSISLLFCVNHETDVEVSVFASGCPVAPAPFCERQFFKH